MSDKFVFDKTSPDADKYTEIDKFLQLTERFCKKGIGSIADKVVSKFGRKNHSKPMSALKRAVNIIGADGIEAVYDDLMHCTRVDRSDIYIGAVYLFRQGNSELAGCLRIRKGRYKGNREQEWLVSPKAFPRNGKVSRRP